MSQIAFPAPQLEAPQLTAPDLIPPHHGWHSSHLRPHRFGDDNQQT